jgi:hypothetical protein
MGRGQCIARTPVHALRPDRMPEAPPRGRALTLDSLQAIVLNTSDQFNFCSKMQSDGFLGMLNLFREKDLDRAGTMRGRDFYAKPEHTPIVAESRLHWSPIEVCVYAAAVVSDGRVCVRACSATITTLSSTRG